MLISTAEAATDWSLCRTPALTPLEPMQPQPSAGGLVTEIEAGRLFSLDGQVLEFSDRVRLRQGERRIEAEHLRLERDQQRIETDRPVLFSDRSLELRASRLLLQGQPRIGQLDEVAFTLSENHLRGNARRVALEGADLSRFEQVRYTTCDPGSAAWSLSASTLEIDRASGRGTATHSVLRLAGVPVFYLPWLQFPIDDRRMSGLLTPTLESSEEGGTALSLPIYWNLAPNYDMTLTPTFYSRRGAKLDTENRYLFAGHEGRLELATLDDQTTGTHRWLERWSHQAELGAGIHASLLYQNISDPAYLDDFEPATDGKSRDWLNSSARFTARPLAWNASLLYERYQTLNLSKPASERPYERWPQIDLDRLFISEHSDWQLDWKNQWSNFRHDSNIEGERLWLRPRLRYRREGATGYLQASLGLDHAAYRLDQAINGDAEPTRDVPLYSLDGSLVFERLAGPARGLRQTLEPRLFLLYVPYREQNGLPDFDTSKLPENLDSIFSDNRFSGGDRVGDAQQISLSLTTRLLDADERERFSATLGQAYWLKDRRVSLDGQADVRKHSPLMGRLRYSPNPAWTLDLSLSYDTDDKRYEQGDIALRQRGDRSALNLEYHLRRDKLEQSTLSWVYPMSPALQLFAKRQYSIRNRKPVENLFGLAWQSCCWGFKLLYREAANREFTQLDRSILFELTLKGLGSAGTNIDAIAESAILGYHPAF